VWTRTSDYAPTSDASLQVLGKNLIWGAVRNPAMEAAPAIALGFDAATGTALWNAADRLSETGYPSLRWFMASADRLLGMCYEVDGSSTRVIGLDPSGTLSLDASIPHRGSDVVCAAGNLVILTTESGSLCAYDTSKNAVAWSVPFQISSLAANTDFNMVADADHCYAYNHGATTAFNLATGATAWQTPGYLSDGASVWLSRPVLVVGGQATGRALGSGMVGLDPATGRTVWDKASFEPVAVTDSVIYGYGDGTLAALRATDLHQLWQYELPSQPSPAPTACPNSGNGSWASDQVVVVPVEGVPATGSATQQGTAPGFVVLDSATGRPLWNHQGSPDADDMMVSWPLAVSGDMIYAASQSTLYAFRAGGPELPQ
jgi:outer membrane protein assembly factor BamB